MEIVNATPLTVGMIAGRAYFPGHSLTIVVKGTFDLVPGGAAEIAEEQLPPTGDEPSGDDGEPAASLRYASDFAFYKPRADLLLVGSAHAPGGHPVPRLRVGFQVGGYGKELEVFGDRWWTSGAFRPEATEPRPFSTMGLRYENAFGGEGFGRNPAGKGFTEIDSEAGYKVLPLPNVEDPTTLVDSPDVAPAPAGFGPVHSEWEGRKRKLGTYGPVWLRTRWPWFPDDLDWGYFNAAPPDLQVEGFLRGDEDVRLENLDPEHPLLASRLPALRVRCFLNERVPGEGEESGAGGHRSAAGGHESAPEAAGPAAGETETRFREVPLNLDTLWIDASERKLVLVWRGLADVRSEEYEEVEHLFVLSEDLASEPCPLDDCRRELDETLAAEEREMEGEETPEPEEPADDSDAEVEEAIAGMNAELVAAGLPTVSDPDDPHSVPTPSAEAVEASERMLEEQGVEIDEVEEPGPLGRPEVEARVARGEGLAGADLTGAELSAVNLARVDLSGAVLADAVLRNATLDGADLTGTSLPGADLTGASLREANLTEADLTGARLGGADLTRAVLAGAAFEGADARGLRIEGAQGAGALFAGADLTEAVATGASLPGADFSGATLERADFRSADLSEAGLEGAAAAGANFSEATLTELRASEGGDFSGASFREVDAVESIWSESSLAGADFEYSNLEGADFTETNFREASLSAANLKFARLTKARLENARLIQCNLFEANLEKADLEGADLRGSNLYGAEVLEARLEGALLGQTNVKMTKLDPS